MHVSPIQCSVDSVSRVGLVLSLPALALLFSPSKLLLSSG